VLQTASGKTFTIEGSLSPSQMQSLARRGAEALHLEPSSATPLSPDSEAHDATVAVQAGILPRLVQGLFAAISAQSVEKTTFTMSCQFIEIYQEGLNDLLQEGISAETKRLAHASHSESGSQLHGIETPVAAAPAESEEATSIEGSEGDSDTTRLIKSAVSSGKVAGRAEAPADAAGHLQIREDPERGVFVAGAVQLPVTSPQHIFEALALGSAHRATANTRMNDRSSRSHSVFQLHITQVRGLSHSCAVLNALALNPPRAWLSALAEATRVALRRTLDADDR
jgi:hypothetical protein